MSIWANILWKSRPSIKPQYWSPARLCRVLDHVPVSILTGCLSVLHSVIFDLVNCFVYLMCRLSSNQTIYHPGNCTGKFLCIMNFIHSTFNKFRAILRKLLDMEFVCLGRMVDLFSNKIYKDILSAGAHQMEPPSLLISWVDLQIEPFSFVMRLNRMNAPAARCHFSILIGSSLYQRAKPPQGIVLFINLLGKGM